MGRGVHVQKVPGVSLNVDVAAAAAVGEEIGRRRGRVAAVTVRRPACFQADCRPPGSA